MKQEEFVTISKERYRELLKIDALWHKADNHPDEDYYLTDEFHKKLKELYNRKAALKAMINDLK